MPRVKKYSHYKPAGSKANLGASDFPFKNFCKIAQHTETIRKKFLENSNIANKIHELTIDYGKFIVWCAKRLGVGIGTTEHKSF